MEDCVSWSEGEWKINPNCCFKRWLIIKGRSLRMILIHKRLMVSLKRSHAIRKILEKSGPSFIYIRRALSEPLHATHSGKCVYISYLRAASVKDEYTNMESQSYFFFCLPSSWWTDRWSFFVCSFTANNWTSHRRTDKSIHLKETKSFFLYLRWDMASARAFERMQTASVHTLSYLAACSDLDYFNIFFSVWSRILYH